MTAEKTFWRSTRRSRLILIPVIALLVLLGWSLASPLSGSPDDDFHQASIWCAGGLEDGVCQAVPGHPDSRAVPAEVSAGGPPCFAHDPKVSASCLGATNGTGMTPTDRVNTKGLYPPFYYATMHLLVTGNPTFTILAIRAVNALLFVGLSTVICWLMLPIRRPTLMWGWAISLVPMGLFLIPSVNPSSWAITSAGLLWFSLVGYFESHGRRRIALGALAVVVAFMGGGARSDAAVYSILGVGVALLLTVQWRSRRFWLSAILPLGIVVMSALLYLAGTQSRSALGYGDSTGSPITLAFRNLLEVPKLWAGPLGAGELGWRDTALPASVWVIALLCFGALTFAGLRALDVRKALTLSGMALVLVALPVIILVSIHALVGAWLQPRYLLPLIVIFAGVALFQAGRRPIELTRPQWWVIVAGLSIAQSAALHENIRRYVTGVDVYGIGLGAHAEWWWNIPLSPTALWILVSLLFAAMLALMVLEFRRWPVEPAPNGGSPTEGHSGVALASTGRQRVPLN